MTNCVFTQNECNIGSNGKRRKPFLHILVVYVVFAVDVVLDQTPDLNRNYLDPSPNVSDIRYIYKPLEI